MVCSGDSALVFMWQGDALYTKRAAREAADEWTSFILPARDPYVPPDMVDFGSFLASALAFTSSLSRVEVFVDGESALCIEKAFPRPPVTMALPLENSWWNRNSIVLASPSGLFSLPNADGLTDTELHMCARFGPDLASTAHLSARVVAAHVTTRCSVDVRRRMERVTKKSPMESFPLRLLLAGAAGAAGAARGDLGQRKARAILDQFAPRLGAGRLYIGFRTSQTTGLAVHLAAPFIPTVEREAVDLVDPTLAEWNSELLHISGVVMRLALEHGMMTRIGALWAAEEPGRRLAEGARLDGVQRAVAAGAAPAAGLVRSVGALSTAGAATAATAGADEKSRGGNSFMSGFASFMGQAASEVKRIAVSVVDGVGDGPAGLLAPGDARPVSNAEREAIMLMRSFVPARSTPDSRVGATVARGFEGCLPNLAAPVLTTAGVVRGTAACTPHLGMEGFLSLAGEPPPLVRAVVLGNATEYVQHVCRVLPLSIATLAAHLKTRCLGDDEALLLLFWFSKYARTSPLAVGSAPTLKESVNVLFAGSLKPVRLRDYKYFVAPGTMAGVPLPFETLPESFTARIPSRTLLRDASFAAWFAPLSWGTWSEWVVDHECLTAARSPAADATRHAVLGCLASEFTCRRDDRLAAWLSQKLSSRRCLPAEGGGLERPVDSYLPIAELETFSGVEMPKVSSALLTAQHITKAFLVALGVREAVSLDVLFSELDRLTWNQDPTGLVRYLTSVRSKLSKDEVKRLRESRFLPSTADESLHAPSELSLPCRDLRELPLPFLRWSGARIRGSDEGRFLCDVLGMRAAPSLDSLLRVAANERTAASARARCVAFSASQLDIAGGEFRAQLLANPSLLQRAFLPCQRVNPVSACVAPPAAAAAATTTTTTGLCKPSDCFTDSLCAQMGFWTVQREFELAALRFQVEREPSGVQYTRALLDLVQAVKADTLLDDARGQAIVWKAFEFLSPRVGLFADGEKRMLQGVAIVPVWTGGPPGRRLVWRRPGDVFFAADSSAHSTPSTTSCLFDTVPPPNEFLRRAGVKDEPSLLDLCNLIVSSPGDVYERLGRKPKRYEELLCRIAGQYPSLPEALVNQLRRSHFLLATKLSDDGGGGGGRADAEGGTGDEAVGVQCVTYVLACAADIYIVDDALLQRMFNPLCLPLNSSGLDAFYRHLGATFISAAVSRRFDLSSSRNGVAQETSLTAELTDRVLQRRVLILETSSRPISRAAPGLLTPEALRVRQVASITSVYALRGVTRTQQVTCCSDKGLVGRAPASVPPLPPGVKLVLYVTDELDFFDVAESLGRQLYAQQRCGLQDVFLLSQLLETTLAQLRARGFPVDKVVPSAPPPAPAQPPEPDAGASPSAPDVLPPQSAPQNGYKDILLQMFPDADPAWILRQVADKPGENGLREIKERMQKGEYPKAQPSPSAATSSPSRPSTAPGKATSLSRSLMNAFKKRTPMGLAHGSGPAPDGGAGGAHPAPGSGGRRGVSPAAPGGADAGYAEPDDAKTREGTRSVLSSAVRASTRVPAAGVSSPAQTVLPGPPPVAAPSCETIPGQDLVAVGRGGEARAKSSHGFRVFASRLDQDVQASLRFCDENWGTVERFSHLLADLAGIFRLDLKTLAIFYSRSGRCIAFNASGSLHFNLRYFATLHDASSRDRPSREAWIFWYTTCCHELAHNLVAEHNQQHGHYTEAMVEEYFPRLLDRLRRVGL